MPERLRSNRQFGWRKTQRKDRMKTERFHLGAVLSMTTGKLLCQMEDIYKLVAHLAGEPVWTNQLPRVGREAKPHLLAQFPALAAVTGEEVTPENFAAWLYERVAEHGEFLDVAPMPEHAHESIDPLSELAEKVHPDRIVTVST